MERSDFLIYNFTPSKFAITLIPIAFIVLGAFGCWRYKAGGRDGGTVGITAIASATGAVAIGVLIAGLMIQNGWRDIAELGGGAGFLSSIYWDAGHAVLFSLYGAAILALFGAFISGTAGDESNLRVIAKFLVVSSIVVLFSAFITFRYAEHLVITIVASNSFGDVEAGGTAVGTFHWYSMVLSVLAAALALVSTVAVAPRSSARAGSRLWPITSIAMVVLFAAAALLVRTRLNDFYEGMLTGSLTHTLQ